MWFALCLMGIALSIALFYNLINRDYESYTDGLTKLEPFVPEEGYQPISYPPLAFDPNATPEPTVQPPPAPTPIPLDKYALLNKRMMIPDSYDVVHSGVTECRASEPDDNRALVLRGWGYLDELDAKNSSVYLVVSTKFGDNHRFYLTKPESGSSGIIHDANTGRNLDQADFSVIVRIEDTYQDGDYRLGLVVINKDGKSQTKGYTRLDTRYNFGIKDGKIISFER